MEERYGQGLSLQAAGSKGEGLSLSFARAYESTVDTYLDPMLVL
jgi:hypothetical protein